jgi:hypothetical protein
MTDVTYEVQANEAAEAPSLDLLSMAMCALI